MSGQVRSLVSHDQLVALLVLLIGEALLIKLFEVMLLVSVFCHECGTVWKRLIGQLCDFFSQHL